MVQILDVTDPNWRLDEAPNTENDRSVVAKYQKTNKKDGSMMTKDQTKDQRKRRKTKQKTKENDERPNKRPKKKTKDQRKRPPPPGRCVVHWGLRYTVISHCACDIPLFRENQKANESLHNEAKGGGVTQVGDLAESCRARLRRVRRERRR